MSAWNENILLDSTLTAKDEYASEMVRGPASFRWFTIEAALLQSYSLKSREPKIFYIEDIATWLYPLESEGHESYKAP